jgi:hypothetical protein
MGRVYHCQTQKARARFDGLSTLQVHALFFNVGAETHIFVDDGVCKQSFLIAPVQRIPRYVLLLRELQRYTPASHIEDPILADALKKMEETALMINAGDRPSPTTISSSEEFVRLTQLNELLRWSPSGPAPFVVVEPHRRLLRDGVLPQIGTHKR